ncbi:LapA family protein [Streptomyces sp. PT12]|uniref:LapA family protein n=1 Tax=Streptomyces sp. PT12 TaxID=1510197 RepID=UPI000DE33763|nr:LapA family protein [Streptomyces sp. PT12]RBM20843.1 DUF1049 domain-containing protein [Streptomyces sp. PT12]
MHSHHHSQRQGTAGETETFWTTGRVVVAVIAGLTLWFVFANTRQTRIRLLIPEVTMPLWLALLFTLIIGGLAGRYLRHRK